MSDENTAIVKKAPGQLFVESVFDDEYRLSVIRAACEGNRYANLEKVKANVAEAYLRNPKLGECDPATVFSSCMLTARLDVDASGFHNGAALVPRWNSKTKKMECGVMFGYNTLADLATRDGRIRSFTVSAAYEDDDFDYALGTKRFIHHSPKPYKPDERPTHFYAIAWYPDGGFEFEVMFVSEIDRIREKFAAKNSPAWSYSYSEQGKKTVLRRLIKRLPVNPVLAEAIHETDITDGYSFDPSRMAASKGSLTETSESLGGMLDEGIDADGDDEPQATPEPDAPDDFVAEISGLMDEQKGGK